jgi:2-keto-4-pentenoate hydratase/2-oxohepta-3-ene-1,7-dioic acid hydratase in catechol pathway
VRYVSFYDNGHIRPGIVQGEGITAIACETMLEYIALPPDERSSHHTNEVLALLADATLAAPVRPNKNVYCVGRNYLEHAKEGARASGRELNLPEVPTFFSKSPRAIADPNAALEFRPRWTGKANLPSSSDRASKMQRKRTRCKPFSDTRV